MESSWKVVEFEMCIPGLEKVMEISKMCLCQGKVMEFQFFSPTLFLADG